METQQKKKGRLKMPKRPDQPRPSVSVTFRSNESAESITITVFERDLVYVARFGASALNRRFGATAINDRRHKRR